MSSHWSDRMPLSGSISEVLILIRSSLRRFIRLDRALIESTCVPVKFKLVSDWISASGAMSRMGAFATCSVVRGRPFTGLRSETVVPIIRRSRSRFRSRRGAISEMRVKFIFRNSKAVSSAMGVRLSTPDSLKSNHLRFFKELSGRRSVTMALLRSKLSKCGRSDMGGIFSSDRRPFPNLRTGDPRRRALSICSIASS